MPRSVCRYMRRFAMARRRMRSEVTKSAPLRLIRWSVCFAWLIAGAASICFAADPPLHNPVNDVPKESPAWLPGYQLRFPLRAVGDRTKSTAQSIIARVPTGGWLKPDGSDIAVQNSAGERVPIRILSHDPHGETMIQFRRRENDVWYWAYAVNPQHQPLEAEPIQEGLSLEVREWTGENFENWAMVREGLVASEHVIGNALVPEIAQNCNPVRPNDPRQFAASYRGFFKIETDGVYRFFVNAEDASFLFIDEFLAVERGGTNQKLTGKIATNSIGVDVELKAGVHPFEVHHVLGNNPTAVGYCTLLWVPPGAKSWAFVPRTNYVYADFAQVAGVEAAAGKPAAQFHYGIDDTLRSGEGSLVYLAQFEAQGVLPADEQQLVWDFGDGSTGRGRSVTHVYFKGGNYPVKLKSGTLPPFERNVHVWPAPGNSSPFSLAKAVHTMAKSNWKQESPERIFQILQFLLVCEQPDRWQFLNDVAAHLLTLPEQDLKAQAQLLTARMEALGELGRSKEAIELGETSLPKFKKIPSLGIEIQLAIADIHRKQLKQPAEASKIYESILSENRRIEHPNLRITAIRWGDLLAETGDLAAAGDRYRMASTLGGEAFRSTDLTDAITRGGSLRIAEQRLRGGDIRQTRAMLDRIELNYPEQKLEGLYRFLKAEVDRHGGRYETALRNYEVLLQLTQWAGFHDRALHGVADAYYRMGDYKRALEWLQAIEKTFPRYYEKQMLAAYRTQVEGRLARIQVATENKSAGAVQFTDVVCNFEPEEKEPWGKIVGGYITPSFGLVKPHVAILTNFQTYVGYLDIDRPVTNLTGEGEYWIEMWYRESLSAKTFNPHLHFYLYGPKIEHSDRYTGTVYFDPTFGQWRKVGFRLKAPLTQDGRLVVTIRQVTGVMEIDGLTVRPVSDREVDSLTNFVEGPEAE